MVKRIDFHVHTEFSNDSNLKVEDILNKAKKEDFYIAIADHNEISGYLKSQKFNEKMRVIPGIEAASSEGIHILFYCTKKEDLVKFYEEVIRKNKTKDLYRLNIGALDIIKKGKEYGTFIGLPHPFIKSMGLLNSKIKDTERCLKLVDFYEIYNGSTTNSINKAADNFHKKNLESKPIIVGSDAHFLTDVGNVLLEVNNFKSLDDLFKNLKSKNNIITNSKFKITDRKSVV